MLLPPSGEEGGMLDGYGLHTIIWDSADERLGDFLVASPADATGRGLELHVRQGGAAADLTGTEVYFLWRHKMTGRRGCEPMEEIDESLGQYVVYYPAAMQESEGAVDAQFMVSWDDKSISTRAFTIRVEPVIVGGTESEDGFALFVETIKRYEGAIEITTAAADAANEAAEAAGDAADSASAVAAAIQQAATRGDYDGADGYSPTATVTQTEGGCAITITDRNGTTTADVAKGVKGDKGDTGEAGPQGPKGDTGNTGATGPQGPKGDTGDTGPQGATGPAGADGTPCTHSWNGSVLTVTSAAGTSSADLRGPQGIQGVQGETGPQGETRPQGATGPQGPQGPAGTTPDLSAYATKQYVDDAIAALANLEEEEF